MSILTQLTMRQRHAALFQAMSDRLGLSEAFARRAGHGDAPRRAVDRCMSCDQVSACESWLAENAAPVEAPGYCRNHDMFERLKHDIEAEGFKRA
ncbi:MULTISPECIES: DUF6455 family protein [unclassified Roseitalea]|uniref:DUF6455 family protein n=1 Tax=unclassified Roseitalea TaxID=2639107 RepID=UPI00273F9DC5|nr:MULTISPECIES: DUF6455 family protein [unclassified Roseitalea]